MKRSKFKLIITAIALFIGFTLHTPAQEDTGILSGRVVDLRGNPVARLPVFVAPLDFHGESVWRVYLPHGYAKLRRAHTDPEGRFSITGILPGPLHFGMLPYNIDNLLPTNFRGRYYIVVDIYKALIVFGMESDDFEPDLELLFLRIRGITFYPRIDYTPVAFGIKPGTDIDNVVVTVQPRMRIRGQILFQGRHPTL